MPDYSETSFRQKLLHGYCVRLHMFLILAAVTASGILGNKLMLECGLRSMRWRYPLATAFSYAVFLGLVRVWIWYVCARQSAAAGFDPGDAVMLANSESDGVAFPGLKDIFDIDLGDDGWQVILMLVLLVAAIFLVGGYLVWVAPSILPEAAWQVVLASALTRMRKEGPHYGWMRGVVRSTALPFVLVLVCAGGLGYFAHQACPGASRLMEVLHCAAQ